MLHFPAIKRPGESFQASVDSSSRPVIPASRTKQKYIKMFSAVSRVIFAAFVVAILLCMVDFTEANYKNAPMNGIMFGKRGPTEYDSRSKAFTALCEIATEACQAWFPVQENK